jgi:hypothetical protein
MRRRLGIALVCLAAVAGAAVYAFADRLPPMEGKWQRQPAGPLSPRDAALGVWTGREVVVFGGVDVPSCPNCSGDSPPEPLRDGAAFDPGSRRWRRIADTPIPVPTHASVEFVAGEVYVRWEDGFLAYSVARNLWREGPRPPGKPGDFGIEAAGGRMLVSGERWLGAYDPVTRRWSRLPRSSKDAVLIWTGKGLVAMDCRPRPEKEGACLTTAEVLDGGRWEPLPPTKINWLGGSWRGIDGHAICACLGDSNSQRQWVGKPAYPNGGILDVASRRWSPLPDPPPVTSGIWNGVVSARSAAYSGAGGFVLDLDRRKWMRMPPLPYRSIHGNTYVDAGRSLFSFGGTRNLELLRDAVWMWTPPPR